MTLTKNDLEAIDQIITKRVQPIEKGQFRLENGQMKLEKSILALEGGQAGLKKSMSALEDGQIGLEKGQMKIEKRFDKLFNFLDKEHSKLKMEVKDVQVHLGLPVLDF